MNVFINALLQKIQNENDDAILHAQPLPSSQRQDSIHISLLNEYAYKNFNNSVFPPIIGSFWKLSVLPIVFFI